MAAFRCASTGSRPSRFDYRNRFNGENGNEDEVTRLLFLRYMSTKGMICLFWSASGRCERTFSIVSSTSSIIRPVPLLRLLITFFDFVPRSTIIAGGEDTLISGGEDTFWVGAFGEALVDSIGPS